MRLYAQIPRQTIAALPLALRQPIERALEEILPTVQAALVASVQRLGAVAVDQTVEKLGLGRFGIRLTQASLSPTSENWEVIIPAWTTASVAEASELLVHRGLEMYFDLSAGEWFGIESISIRWNDDHRRTLRAQDASSSASAGGLIVLNWSVLEREDFRRRVLENLHQGAHQSLCLHGMDGDGLSVVEVDLVVRAKARGQISGKSGPITNF